MPVSRFPRRCLTWGIVFFCTSIGCQQTVDTAPHAGPTPLQTEPALTLSPNQRVGTVKWVSATGTTLVVELDPTVDLPAGGRLIARIPNSTPMAVIQITTQGHGSYRPAQVLAGTVTAGLEVVAPGPTLRKWGEDSLNKRP